MSKLKWEKFISIFYTPVFLCLFSIFVSMLTHHYIFTQNGVLSSGDWAYFYNESADSVSSNNMYIKYLGFGSVMPFPNNWPMNLVLGSMLKNGLGYDIFTRLIFLVPIVIFTPLFSYMLYYNVTKNKLSAFFASVIYTYSTFFLKLQLDWLTYANIWWIFPLLLLLVQKYLSTKRIIFLGVIPLVTGLGIVFELRIMIVVASFLGLYLLILFLTNKRIEALFLTISLGAGLLLHSFWLVPLVFGDLFQDIISYASSSIFPSYFNILDVLTLRSYQWNSGLVFEPFISQKIEPQFLLVPLLCLLGLYSFPKMRIKAELKPFYYLCMVSILLYGLLAKQENPPFKDLYAFLFYNVPFFSLFRESSKFFIVVALCISLFAGIGVSTVINYFSKYGKSLALLVALFIFIAFVGNSLNFMTTDIGLMTRGVQIPKEQINLKNTLNQETHFSRVLWLPFKPRFAFYSSNKPFVSNADVEHILKTQDISANYSKLKALFNYGSVEYIIIPEQEYSKVSYTPAVERVEAGDYRYYGDRDRFLTFVDAIPSLEKLPNLQNQPTIYKNIEFLSNFYVSDQPLQISLGNENSPENVPYVQISPTLYKINATDVYNKSYLHFSDTFSKNWVLVSTDQNLTSATQLVGKKFSERQGFKNVVGLTSFSLKDLSKENDAPYDTSIYVLFKPYTYLIVGIYASMIVLMTLILINIYGIYDYLQFNRSRGK